MDYLVHAKRSMKYGSIATTSVFFSLAIESVILQSVKFYTSIIILLAALIATAKYKGRGYQDFNYVVFSYFLGPLLLAYGVILYIIEKIRDLT